eukprot:3540118-Prymnesium_polylepis.1
MEAASDARYMHDMLRKMLRAPVFLGVLLSIQTCACASACFVHGYRTSSAPVTERHTLPFHNRKMNDIWCTSVSSNHIGRAADSSVLVDLRKLITEGVHKSDVMVLLATQDVLSNAAFIHTHVERIRPGSYTVELRRGSTSLMANSGFSLDGARDFMLHLDDAMERKNPAGIDILHQRLGPDLGELKDSVIRAIDANRDTQTVFDSRSGDHEIVATMKDVIELMAK